MFSQPGHPEAVIPGYRTTFARPRDLSEGLREILLGLYAALYALPSRELFFGDLDGKDEVLLLWHGEEVVGFTTHQVYDFPFQGVLHRIVFSGDTVVRRDHWGQPALAPAWIRRMGEVHREDPARPLEWFLVVKGHRTFRYLPAFCLHFHPHWDQDTSDLRPLADALATHRFGKDYDPSRGVVTFPRSRGHLRPEVARPSEEERRHPAVAFFLERNPGYLQGEELVCLFPFEAALMRPLARRLFAGKA